MRPARRLQIDWLRHLRSKRGLWINSTNKIKVLHATSLLLANQFQCDSSNSYAHLQAGISKLISIPTSVCKCTAFARDTRQAARLALICRLPTAILGRPLVGPPGAWLIGASRPMQQAIQALERPPSWAMSANCCQLSERESNHRSLLNGAENLAA